MTRALYENGARREMTVDEEKEFEDRAEVSKNRLAARFDTAPAQTTVLRIRRALRTANRFAAFITWLQAQPQDMQDYWQYGDGGVIRRADPEVETTRLGLGIGKPMMDALFKAAG